MRIDYGGGAGYNVGDDGVGYRGGDSRNLLIAEVFREKEENEKEQSDKENEDPI